jgi:predicted O-methyltransferase YrrM
MTPQLQALLQELEAFGRARDAAAASVAEKMLNCGPDTGRLLWLLARFGRCRRVLEVGTSNGYSTLWLADAAERVVTLEHDPAKRAMALDNFRRAGLATGIALVGGDAGELLAGGLGAPFDLVFLDADRRRYVGWWPSLRPAVAVGGLLVVDNVLSHAAECAPLLAMVQADPSFVTQTVAIGNGLLLAYRTGRD